MPETVFDHNPDHKRAELVYDKGRRRINHSDLVDQENGKTLVLITVVTY